PCAFSWSPVLPPSDIYTLSLHGALPILIYGEIQAEVERLTKEELSPELILKILDSPDVSDKLWALSQVRDGVEFTPELRAAIFEDRKSTRLNSSHVKISYAVFCLKKKIR